MSVWVMPSVDVYENFLQQSQVVASGCRRWQAVGTPLQAAETTNPNRRRACRQCVKRQFGFGGNGCGVGELIAAWVNHVHM